MKVFKIAGAAINGISYLLDADRRFRRRFPPAQQRE